MLHSHLSSLVAKNRRQRVLGCMTGTSLDGVDLCLCSFQDSLLFSNPPKPISEIVTIEKFATLPYPPELLKLLRNLLSTASTSASTASSILALVCEANTMWSREIAKLINAFLEDVVGEKEGENEGEDHRIVIASHGQTIWHISGSSTLQIGDTEVLCQLTNRIVVGNFRAADVACGGSGAPLVPFLDRFLASDAMRRHVSSSPALAADCGLVLLQNLGGIGNVSLVLTTADEDKKDESTTDSSQHQQHILCAFDTGPANVILNELVLSLIGDEGDDDEDRWSSCRKVMHNLISRDQSSASSSWREALQKSLNLNSLPPSFDENGFYSSRGNIIPELLEESLRSEYFEVLRVFKKNLSESDKNIFMQFEKRLETISQGEKQNGTNSEDLISAFREILMSMLSKRSTGREDFGASFVQRIYLRQFNEHGADSKNENNLSSPQRAFQYFCDLCATAVAFTAKSIGLHLDIVEIVWNEFLRRRRGIGSEQTHPVIMLCSGGGSLHPLMMSSIQSATSSLTQRVAKLSDLVQLKTKNSSFPFFDQLDDAKEAIAFALLGHEKMCSLCSNTTSLDQRKLENSNCLGTNEPAATGAKKKCFLGQISCP